MSQIPDCPNCGIDGRYREWIEVTGGRTLYREPLAIRSEDHQREGPVLKSLVCKRCGLVQLFANPYELAAFFQSE